MKKNIGPSKVLIFIIIMIVTCSLLGFYAYKDYVTYKEIDISIKKNTIEYGTANYNLKEIVDKVEGEIISIKKSIDTNIIGKQEIIVAVEKDSVVKEIPIKVEVVDTLAPKIELKEESLTFTEDEEFNLLDNINAVTDAIDGDIVYKDISEVNEDDTNYYTFKVDSDINEVGNHNVNVVAVDKFSNVSEASFKVEIKPVVKTLDFGVIHNDLPTNASFSSIVDIAYSLIGSPYVAGGNNPSGFDCSGFVQYVYSQVGRAISRSSSTQAYDGMAVSYENAVAGDILSWGYDTAVTHSALYVGNGMMIHATNPRQGVILSDVSAWMRGSGTRVLTVRRIV